MEDNLIHISGEYFYSFAALFSCIAYILRNILWLRILLVIAAIIYIISGVMLGISAMVGWNAAYLIINLFHVVILLLDRITIALPDDTAKIYHQYFSTLSTREFKKLIITNQFCSFQSNMIVEEAEIPDRLYILLQGSVEIIKKGEQLATLSPGDFIGEMSFLTKEPASASANAESSAQCAYWTHSDLEKLKIKNINVYDKFIAIIGCDLVRKLKNKNDKQAGMTTKLDFIV